MICNDSKHWLGSYSVSGSIPDTEDMEENKTVPTLKELTF